ncbi:adenylyl-sulfate kinase [Pseudomonas sp.]|uniref:adenylyl-sulfate kinase n=1 Tax=Pseudomonas sp. TaxID=306 RepID=UPI002583FFDA|nr:adenylyl-sulfate kinase [Pseudomonas sp.]
MNDNLTTHAFTVNQSQRSTLKRQRPAVIWLTGLSGSGKSTIANALETALAGAGHHTYLLDGDNVRQGLCKDLGFSDVDRVENIRRIAEVANLFVDAGIITITAFISPFRQDRELAKQVIGDGNFIEVFVDTPLTECERRDPKGLYEKARRGFIKNFTGIDSAYEPPVQPKVIINTLIDDVEQAVSKIIAVLPKWTNV